VAAVVARDGLAAPDELGRLGARQRAVVDPRLLDERVQPAQRRAARVEAARAEERLRVAGRERRDGRLERLPDHLPVPAEPDRDAAAAVRRVGDGHLHELADAGLAGSVPSLPRATASGAAHAPVLPWLSTMGVAAPSLPTRRSTLSAPSASSV